MSMDRLIAGIQKTGNPSVMGLDPDVAHIPAFLKQAAEAEHGRGLEALAEAAFAFNKGLMDAAQGLIPAVKPQVAYYEALGPRGVDVFYRTIRYAREKGYYVIADGKRNDIGSTAAAYARAYLGGQEADGQRYDAFDADSLTVNPYLGTDGVLPFVEQCGEEKSIFVLVKTSNPSSGELQDMTLQDGGTLYEKVASLVCRWGESSIGQYGYNGVGAVVGATYPAIGEKLRAQMPHTYFLVPGYGAQGGGAKDIAGCFNRDGLGAIVNSSRGIMCAYRKQEKPEEEFMECARREIVRMRDEITAVIG